QQRRGGPAKPYEQVVAFFRCIEFLTESVTRMPFNVSTQDDQILESGPIANLLDRPNPQMSIEDLFAETLGWLLMTGEAYWIFTERAGRLPTEMVPAGPAQVRPRTAQADGRGPVVGWLFRPS